MLAYYMEEQAGKNQCILVIKGAMADGHKELVAVADGYREKRGQLDSGASGLEASRPGGQPEAGCWGRCLGILGGIAQVDACDKRATVLVSQDG